MAVALVVSSDVMALAQSETAGVPCTARLAAGLGQVETDVAETRPGSVARAAFVLETGVSPNIHPTRP
jgi:hypothetical protein